jgi:hypothetical protein
MPAPISIGIAMNDPPPPIVFSAPAASPATATIRSGWLIGPGGSPGRLEQR